MGHRNITTEGRFLAAVKACGDEAVLSHYACVCLHDLLKFDGRPIDVTARTKRKHPGIKTHRSQQIERIVHKGIPATTKLRAVIDFATQADDATIKRALRQARFSVDEPRGSRRGCERSSPSPPAARVKTAFTT